MSHDMSHDRDNLVTAQTLLGKCRGSLQGLRHECLGLVNWYQTIPSKYLTTCHYSLDLYTSIVLFDYYLLELYKLISFELVLPSHNS